MMAPEETGRTLDEAIEAGLRKLGIAREYVLVETLATGARGFLGLGRQEAEEHQGGVRLDVSGKDGGLLIGKHGQTLEALQFLVGRILDRQIRDRNRGT